METKGKNFGKRVFIPLDGQQRLTTLFLLYWYACIKKDSNLNKWQRIDFLKILSRFRYETRISSRDFCKMLTEDIQKILEQENLSENFLDRFSTCFEEGNTLSVCIKDLNIYYNEWNNDTTISSMLVMLDEIHNRFKNIDNLYTKLIQENLITFEVQKLENLSSEDDIYIKMNARGQQLSDFENFKANLEEDFREILEKKYLIREDYLRELGNLSKRIDNEWAKIFWSFREKQIDRNNHILYKYDDFYLIFIKNILMNHIMQYKEKDEILEFFNNKENMFFYDDWKFAVDEQFLNTLNNFLNYYEYIQNQKNSDIFDCVAFFKKASNDFLEYKEYIMLYAMSTFFNNIDENKENVQVAFDNWIRVIRNLAENTIIDSAETYKSAIKAVNSIAQYSNDIIYALANERIEISGFNQEQIRAEKTKAKLLLKEDEKWDRLLYDIDKNDYLRGLAGFLFKFSKLWIFEVNDEKLNWNEYENQKYFEIISKYFYITEILFQDRYFAEGNEKLLIRALLVQGNYLLLQNQSYSFLVYEDRDISFKRLLSGRECEEKREYFKMLLDEMSISCETINIENVEKNLRKIINQEISSFSNDKIIEYSFNTPGIWRKYFIKYFKIYDELNPSYMYIRIDNRDICNYLMEKQRLSSFVCCFEIYKLKLDLEELGCTVKVTKGKGYYAPPSEISQINDIKIKIIYDSEKAYKEKIDCYIVNINDYRKEIFSEEDLINFLKDNGII